MSQSGYVRGLLEDALDKDNIVYLNTNELLKAVELIKIELENRGDV